LEDTAKIEALRNAVQIGIDSGIAEGDVVGKLRQRISDRAAANVRKTA